MIQIGRMVAQNFGPFEGLDFDWSAPGLTLISGDNRDTTAADSNGAGKSHLPKALSWVLYGDTIEGDRYGEIIRANAPGDAVVEQDLMIEGEPYRVRRERSKRGGKLELSQAGKDITRPTMDETQALIVSLLGLDFRAFRSTVLYGQGDGTRFAAPNTTDAERKAVLFRVLRLDGLDLALDFVKSTRAASERSRLEAGSKIEPLRASLRAQDPAGLKVELADATRRLAEGRGKGSSRAAVEEVIREAEEALAEFGDLDAEAAKGDIALRRISTEIASYEAEARALERTRTRIESEVARFDEGRCPTCGTSATARTVCDHVQKLRADIAEQTRAIESAEATAMLARGALKTAQRKRAAVEDGRRERDVLKDGLAAARRDLAVLDGVAERVRLLEGEVARLKERLKQNATERARITTAIQEAEEDGKRAEVAVAHADFWIRGFGHQGLRSHILDGIIGELGDLTNGYLGILSDGDIRVAYDTETTLKSGKTKDRFQIAVDIEGAGHVQPSGGQWRKITIAADLALMDLVARRERAAFDLLIMDEALDGLDATGQARVVDLLNHLRAKRNGIVVISHAPALSDVFERTFRVTKEGGASKLDAA